MHINVLGYLSSKGWKFSTSGPQLKVLGRQLSKAAVFLSFFLIIPRAQRRKKNVISQTNERKSANTQFLREKQKQNQ